MISGPKAKASVQELLTWAESVLGRLGVSTDNLRRLHTATTHSATSDTDDFVRIVQFLFKHQSSLAASHRNQALEDFFRVADASRFPLNEWTEALSAFIQYNEEKRITANLEMMTEYMSCAAVSQEAKLGQLRFGPLVKYFLEQYGFENQNRTTS